MGIRDRAALMTGCAVNQAKYDYTAFKQSKPKSIVVLPPLNESPDIDATYSVLSQVTLPLAEAGYHVLPVTPAADSLLQNCLSYTSYAADDQPFSVSSPSHHLP